MKTTHQTISFLRDVFDAYMLNAVQMLALILWVFVRAYFQNNTFSLMQKNI